MFEKNSGPITFPNTFRADNLYRWGLSAFTVMVIAEAVFSITRHASGISWIGLGIPVLVLWAIVISLRIHVDEAGLKQNWILGNRTATWDQIARVEKGRGTVFIVNDKGKEMVHLAMLPHPAQLAIADEVVARTGMRKSSDKPKYPVLELWVR